jgi:serine/threonine-protein kinase
VPFGRYVIRSRLGRGGMGEVFLADQLGPLGPVRPVALKRMLPRFASDENALMMFLGEMGTAALLNHPNIATTYDFGEIDGVYFLAMEYVDGLPLNRILDAVGTIAPSEALYILRSIADALAHAHALKLPTGEQRPVVHSDVTPHNIMVSSRGTVKLLDFGIARAEAMASKERARGKLGYAAPEQMRGAPTDRRFDLWAMGILLYEMLVGERPYRGDNPIEVLEQAEKRSFQQLRERKPDASELDPLLLRALEPDPPKRFSQAEDFVAAVIESQRYFPSSSIDHLAALVEKAGGAAPEAEGHEVTGTGVAVIDPGPLAQPAGRPEMKLDRLPGIADLTDATVQNYPRIRAPTWRSRLMRSILIGGIAGLSMGAVGTYAYQRATEPAETTPPPLAPRMEPPPVIEKPPPPQEPPPREEPPHREAVEPRPEKTPVPSKTERPRESRRTRSRRESKKTQDSAETVAQERKPIEGRGSLGVLYVRSVPWSKVTLDGLSLGEGIIAAKPVPAGRHKLTLTPGNDKFPPREIDLEMKAGVVTRVSVDFDSGSVRIEP